MTYLDPALPVLVLLGGLAAVGAWRRRARFRYLWAAAALGLFLWSWPPFAWLTAYSVEFPYPWRFLPRQDAEAIVVLSAGIDTANASRPVARLDDATLIRVFHAAWLYDNWCPLPVVTSGGPSPGQPGIVLAELMRDELVDQGVPLDDIWVEGRSFSTYQNAVYSAELLRARGITRVAVVTEAYHMLRAELCFRAQGLEVVPAPVDFHSAGYTWRPQSFLPGATAIRYNDQILHEWGGLLYYWIRGRF